MHTGAGDDYLCVDPGSGLEVRIVAGAGNDFAVVTSCDSSSEATPQSASSGSIEPITIIFHGGAGDDEVTGGTGRDVLFGGAGDDTLRGGRGPDVLSGGNGRDFLFGNAGDDVLRGGAGRDLLNAGRGVDRCRAGSRGEALIGCEG